MKKAFIGRCILGREPKIAAVIDRPMTLSEVKKLKAGGADIIEIRADLFKCPIVEVIAFAGMIKKSIGIPAIATIRENEKIRSGMQRIALFDTILPFVDAIDIEIDALDSADIIKMTSEKTVIVSEHNYEKTPSNSALASIVKKAVNMGADIIKIAAMAADRKDAARLMAFASERKENLVVISMGENGTATRLSAFLFGSLYTYAFTSESVASGQLSLKDTSAILGKMYPGLRT